MLLAAFAKLRKRLLPSSCLSVPTYGTRLPPSNFHEIRYLIFFPKHVEHIQISLLVTTITGTSHEDLFTFMTTPR